MDQPVENAAEIEQKALREGSTLWSSLDAPWLGMIDPNKFSKALLAIETLNASTVLSSHLPTATGMTKSLLGNLAEAYKAPPFVGPDQEALEKMMVA